MDVKNLNTPQIHKFDKEVLKLQYEEAEILLQQTYLNSPINGVIESVFIDKGEGVERLKEIFRVVSLDLMGRCLSALAYLISLVKISK